MLIWLVCPTLHSDNGCILSSDNGGTGHLSKVTGSKLKKLLQLTLIQKELIQPVSIQLVCRTLPLDNGGTLSSDNGGAGHLSKVTNCKLNKLIQPVFIYI